MRGTVSLILQMLLVFPRDGIHEGPRETLASSEGDRYKALGTPSSSLRVYCSEILKNKKSGTPNEWCLILGEKNKYCEVQQVAQE